VRISRSCNCGRADFRTCLCTREADAPTKNSARPSPQKKDRFPSPYPYADSNKTPRHFHYSSRHHSVQWLSLPLIGEEQNNKNAALQNKKNFHDKHLSRCPETSVFQSFIPDIFSGT